LDCITSLAMTGQPPFRANSSRLRYFANQSPNQTVEAYLAILAIVAIHVFV